MLRNAELTQLLVLQYAQRALLINEFTDHRWQTRVYPGTGQYAGQNLGNGILSQFGFPRDFPPTLTLPCPWTKIPTTSPFTRTLLSENAAQSQPSCIAALVDLRLKSLIAKFYWAASWPYRLHHKVAQGCRDRLVVLDGLSLAIGTHCFAHP